MNVPVVRYANIISLAKTLRSFPPPNGLQLKNIWPLLLGWVGEGGARVGGGGAKPRVFCGSCSGPTFSHSFTSPIWPLAAHEKHFLYARPAANSGTTCGQGGLAVPVAMPS